MKTTSKPLVEFEPEHKQMLFHGDTIAKAFLPALFSRSGEEERRPGDREVKVGRGWERKAILFSDNLDVI